MDADLHARLTAWRRHLHANPRLSLEEADTAAFVVQRLRDLGVTDIATGIGGHGVVATIARGDGNRSVALRADMDALPIAEENPGLPWRSTVPGAMHACGHDGHTVALLGAAALLLADRSWSGTVRLVFQPAEEGAGGAARMLADGLFRRFPAQRIFGWHNWPGLPVGTIALHDGPVMAAGKPLRITLEGVPGHAALPHLARDPILAAGHLIVAVQSLVSRTLDPVSTGVVSLTMIEGGTALNQIAGSVRLGGTLRWLDDSAGAALCEGLRRIAEGIGATFGVGVSVELGDGIGVTANHPEAVAIAAEAAAAVAPLRRDLPPAMTGEDFSRFAAVIPAAFVWIGAGEGGPELHHPAFDFNDAILPVASRWLAEVAKRSLA
ncbi:MAG: amidohydrolase [Acetobacteraceae bacterium]|nr:amidohydrolase [Acetobacteraceae bacterium]